ncbi:MAG: methionine--tRNA ligase subunit beta [Thermodesulfovibrionales bacterium]|nr:methionine--tRNA ligase subunit beta [Thermodesulfovibrionales bacterium]
MITIEDFSKIELRTGKVLEAKRIEGSNKLIVMKVDTGNEVRQIVAGIGKVYSPEELTGKTIVVITNLQPVKLMGVESQGMLLAASDDEGRLSILTTEREVKIGSKIK